MDDTRTVIRNPNFSGNVNIPFGGTVLYDEFPSTEIDYGNPRNDPRVVPEEMGLVGDRGIMSVAEVKPNTLKQLKRMGIFKEGQKSPYTDKDEIKMMVPGLENATDEELDQILAGTFTV